MRLKEHLKQSRLNYSGGSVPKISKRILSHLQEDPVSSPRGSCVIFKRILRHLQELILGHLQEDHVSSSRGPYVISKRILFHLQENPVSSPRGSCVISQEDRSCFISKRNISHFQKDPLPSPRGSGVISNRIRCHLQE